MRRAASPCRDTEAAATAADRRRVRRSAGCSSSRRLDGFDVPADDGGEDAVAGDVGMAVAAAGPPRACGAPGPSPPTVQSMQAMRRNDRDALLVGLREVAGGRELGAMRHERAHGFDLVSPRSPTRAASTVGSGHQAAGSNPAEGTRRTAGGVRRDRGGGSPECVPDDRSRSRRRCRYRPPSAARTPPACARSWPSRPASRRIGCLSCADSLRASAAPRPPADCRETRPHAAGCSHASRPPTSPGRRTRQRTRRSESASR